MMVMVVCMSHNCFIFHPALRLILPQDDDKRFSLAQNYTLAHATALQIKPKT